MLTNILSLSNPLIWHSSLALAESGLDVWLAQANPKAFTRVYLTGCGSSLYNGQVGKYALERLAHLEAEAWEAFAFSQYHEPALLGPKTLVVGISTTGQTQTTCQALQLARRAGAATLAITAQAGSPITQAAQASLLTGGQDDKISVKTSSYVLALVTLYALAIRLGEQRGVMQAAEGRRWRGQIEVAALGASHFLGSQQDEIQALAQEYSGVSRVFVLGSGPNRGTAEEAALKVIEMAKLHAEAHDLENFLHGRLRSVDQANPLIFLAPQGKSSAKVLDFLTVTNHIQAPSIVLSNKLSPGIQKLATHAILMPEGLDETFSPLLYILPLHLFGYYLALQRGYDPNARRYPLVPQNVRYGEPIQKLG